MPIATEHSPIERCGNAASSHIDERMNADAATRGASSANRSGASAADPSVLDALLPDENPVILPHVQNVGGGLPYRVAKRAFDIAASALGLMLLALPMACIATAVRRQSPGPAIYKQLRVGKGGELFLIYKFRSMYAHAEEGGAQWCSEHDPRVTPLGRTLRAYHLDELPQLWNVIRGDMSLVGPRPERPVFCNAFRKRIEGWDQRTLVRPGITGLAQVTGGYDLLPKEKARLDISYIEHRSAMLDLRIIARTAQLIVLGEPR